MSFDTLAPLPKHGKNVEVAAWEADKVRNNLWNSPLTLKYRTEQFLKNVFSSSGTPFCKSCQHNVDWKCVAMCKDHFQTNVQMENKENTIKVKLGKKRIWKTWTGFHKALAVVPTAVSKWACCVVMVLLVCWVFVLSVVRLAKVSASKCLPVLHPSSLCFRSKHPRFFFC